MTECRWCSWPERRPDCLDYGTWWVAEDHHPDAWLWLTLVPKAHVADFVQLDREAGVDLWHVLDDIKFRKNLDAYCLGSRVESDHLHVTLLRGNTSDPNHQKLVYNLTGPPSWEPEPCSTTETDTGSNAAPATSDESPGT